MLQFTVPQFIDVEDKIIGPMTVRQFLISLVGCIVIAIGWKVFDFSAFLLWAVVNFGIFGTIAFLKINGMSFHFFILNFIQTAKKPKIRVWNKLEPAFISKEELEGPEIIAPKPSAIRKSPVTVSRLAELSLIVDTSGEYEGETVKREEMEIRPKEQPTLKIED